MSRPGQGSGNGNGGNNRDNINTNPNPNGGAGSASGLDPPPNTPITNPTDPWKTKVTQNSTASSTEDVYETSKPIGRYRRCGDPPTFKPPTEKPPPPKPKEGERPPSPVKQTQIRTKPGMEF